MHREAALAAIARRQHSLISHRQAISVGLTDHALRHHIEVGLLERLFRNVYRVAGAPETPEQRLLAPCLAFEREVAASHRAGAWLWDIRPEVIPEISVVRTGSARLPGVVVHRRTPFAPGHVVVRRGIPVTVPWLTICELAAVAPIGVVANALDGARVAGLVTVSDLRRHFERWAVRGRPGVEMMRRLLDERDDRGGDGPDSKFETRAERLILGDPLLSTDVRFHYEVYDDAGNFVAEVDVAWPPAKLAVEWETFKSRSSPQALQHDLTRRNRLVAIGWEVLGFTPEDARRRPVGLRRQIRTVLGARMRLLAG